MTSNSESSKYCSLLVTSIEDRMSFCATKYSYERIFLAVLPDLWSVVDCRSFSIGKIRDSSGSLAASARVATLAFSGREGDPVLN
mmetsp:Transcript_19757/g.51736  ORF Transcript_19757/g.51736 Transcript_19757/m.51736 type:complete len:85 (+) Transcript_19757:267-521(+)